MSSRGLRVPSGRPRVQPGVWSNWMWDFYPEQAPLYLGMGYQNNSASSANPRHHLPPKSTIGPSDDYTANQAAGQGSGDAARPAVPPKACSPRPPHPLIRRLQEKRSPARTYRLSSRLTPGHVSNVTEGAGTGGWEDARLPSSRSRTGALPVAGGTRCFFCHMRRTAPLHCDLIVAPSRTSL